MDSENSYVDDLISEVEKRPVIWKKMEVFERRKVLYKEWKAIAKKVNKTPEEVKKKWRQLKATFYLEEKMFNIQLQEADKGKPLVSYYKGKWPHFSKLFFLYRPKDKVDQSTSTDLFDENNANLSSHDIKVEIDLFEHTDDFEERYLKTLSQNEKYSQNCNKTKDAAENNEVSLKNARKKAKNTDFNDTSDQNETQGSDEIPFDEMPMTKLFNEPVEYTDTDADVLFVKSLVPYYKRLNPIRKLIVKNEMQNLLIKEMVCEQCRLSGPQPNCRCNLSQ